MNKNIFATGFGKVCDIEIGPDGLYVLSSVKHTTSILVSASWTS